MHGKHIWADFILNPQSKNYKANLGSCSGINQRGPCGEQHHENPIPPANQEFQQSANASNPSEILQHVHSFYTSFYIGSSDACIPVTQMTAVETKMSHLFPKVLFDSGGTVLMIKAGSVPSNWLVLKKEAPYTAEFLIIPINHPIIQSTQEALSLFQIKLLPTILHVEMGEKTVMIHNIRTGPSMKQHWFIILTAKPLEDVTW